MLNRSLTLHVLRWSCTAAVASAPFAGDTLPGFGPLTATRAFLGAAALAATAALLQPGEEGRVRPGRRTVGVFAALGAALSLVWISALGRGCVCEGSTYGFSEFAVLVVVATVLMTEDRSALRWLLAGVVVASSYAAGSIVLDGGSGRSGGYLGNANLIGLAVVPGALVLASRVDPGRHRTVAWLVAAGALAVTLLPTFSRSGMLALAVGVLALALLRVSRGRPRRLLLAGAGVTALAAGIAYPLFLDARVSSSFQEQIAAGALLDGSGWDGRSQGLIAASAQGLEPDRRGIRVDVGTPGGGVSLGLPAAKRGQTNRLVLELSSAQFALPVSVALADNRVGAGPAAETAILRGRPTMVDLSWTPTRTAADARAYIWAGAPGQFIIESARFQVGGGTFTRLPALLTGRVEGTGRAAARQEEDDYLRSRLDAARIAMREMVDNPVSGIGWERFPALAGRELGFASLATHNELLRFGAELGVPGLVALLAFLVLSALAVHRTRDERPAVGALFAAGCCGLLFANGLVLVAFSFPLAVALAAGLGQELRATR